MWQKMGDQGRLLSNFYIKNFFTLLLNHSGDSSGYNDTTLVCKDRTIFINKVLLSLAFTSIESALFSLEHMLDIVVVMFPDYTASELIASIETFLLEIKTEDLEGSEREDSEEKDGFEEEVNPVKKEKFFTINRQGNRGNNEGENEVNNIHFVTVEVERYEDMIKCETNSDIGIKVQNDDALRLKCRFCRESFSTTEEKAEHEKSYRDINGELICRFEGCKAQSATGKFKTERCLSNHMRMSHYAKAVKQFTCKICDETFVGNVAYEIHMQRYKDGPDNYKCPEKDCDSSFQFRYALISHFKKHRGILDFTCEECKKQFPTKRGLTVHTKQCHEYVEQICHICSKMFTKKDAFWWHMRNAHVSEEEKQGLKCKICNKGFLNKETLKRHKVVHSEVYNFSCSICEKKFKFKQSWEKHMRAHRGEKPYNCAHCSKSFSTPDKVRRHELIHTGSMEFSCSKCDKKFNQKSNKDTHEKKYHGES